MTDARRVRWVMIGAAVGCALLRPLPGGPESLATTGRQARELLVYAVSLRASGTAGVAGLLGQRAVGGQATDSSPRGGYLTVRGELRLSRYQAGDSGETWLASIRLRAPAPILGGIFARESNERLATEVESPLLVSVASDGQIRELRFGRRGSASAELVVRNLLAQWQITRSEACLSGRRRMDWTGSEARPSGWYRVQYQSTPSERTPGLFLTRRALQYLGSQTQPTEVRESPQLDVRLQGDTRLEVECPSWLILSSRGSTSMESLWAGQTVASSTTDVSIVLQQRQAVSSDSSRVQDSIVTVLREHGSRVRLLEPLTRASRDSTLARNRLGGTSPESLFASLREIKVGSGHSAEAGAVYLKLRGYLFLSPDGAIELLRQLDSLPSGSAPFNVAVTALAAVGTPSAQHALSVLVGRLPGGEALGTVLAVILTVASPESELVDAVKSRASDTEPNVWQARTVLGSFARRVAATRPVQSARIVDSLVAGAERDTSVRGRLLWLQALGNTGHRNSLGVALQAIRAPDATLRAAAARALRFVDDTAALSALLTALADPEPAVRLEAARSLRLRQPSTEVARDALAAYRRESAEANRIALLELVWAGRSVLPDAAGAVREAANHDPSEGVRRAALALVRPQTPPR